MRFVGKRCRDFALLMPSLNMRLELGQESRLGMPCLGGEMERARKELIELVTGKSRVAQKHTLRFPCDLECGLDKDMFPVPASTNE